MKRPIDMALEIIQKTDDGNLPAPEHLSMVELPSMAG